MTDRRSGEKRLHELEFNDLNIHLYLTLNYGTASEHLDLDFMVLYNVFVLSWGLTITQNIIHTISDLDQAGLSDTRSAKNDWIGADTDPEYRIDASLLRTEYWILRMWYFSYSFLINLLKCQQFCVFLSIWGAVCTLMRKKMNLNDFSKWLQYNRVKNLRGSEYFLYPLYIYLCITKYK